MIKPSDKFYRLLKLFEGCKLEAYICTANVVTIGYGNVLNSEGNPFKLLDKINLADAELLLKNEVEKKANFLNKELGKTIVTQNQFDALLLFQYNCGNRALSGSTLFKKVKENPNDKTIAEEFALWNKGGGKEIKGLTIRRKEECKLYFSNTYID
jgi:lysozyme